MKKSLLIGAALLVGAGAFAQTQRKVGERQMAKLNKFAKTEPAAFPTNTNLTSKLGNHNSTQVAPPYTRFSSQMNAFGFIESQQNCLSYNPDLNCVALFQRHTADWPNNAFFPAPGSGKSGYQVVKFTANNGASWDSVNYYQDEVNWGRYPSGVIYNPTGNTTLGNGWFVGTGPTVNSGSAWSANWFASIPIPTGAMPRTVTTNDQQVLLTATAGSVAHNTYFSSYSTCTGGSGATLKVFTGGYKMNQPNSPAGVYGAAVFKGTFNGTNAFTWEQDSTYAYKFTIASDGESSNNTPLIAFGPDGMTGYVLINGADSLATLPAAKQSYQPLVWKTTDGGATWNRVNQNYDWAANNPEIFGNLAETSVGSGIVRPAFFDLWGGAVAVDANGKLHYATAVASAGSINRDSLGFYSKFGYEQYACDNRPWVFDFMTDGNGTWTTAKVTDLFTADLGRTTTDDTLAAYNIWTNTGEFFDYDNRLQVSRSADGTKIFYSWTDADTNNVLPLIDGSTLLYNIYAPNDYPNLYYRGMDVNSGMFTQIYENPGFNASSGGYFFYYVADMAVTTGSGYNLPMTYLDSRAGTFDATTAVDVYYIDDSNIGSGDFTQPAYPVCSMSIGVKEMTGTTVASVSNSFPNPTSGTSVVKVNLNKAEDITLNVTNSIGQLVSAQTVKGVAGENQLTIDASSLNSGIYFYTVISGNSKVTRKLSVTK